MKCGRTWAWISKSTISFCAVLPTAFGDVFESGKPPRGNGIYDFVVSDIHGIRPAELIELQKAGGKVFGTFCVYVPDEVVIACDGAVTGFVRRVAVLGSRR